MEARTPGEVKAWIEETLAQLHFQAKADGSSDATSGRLHELLSSLLASLASEAVPSAAQPRLAALLASLDFFAGVPSVLTQESGRLDVVSQAALAAALLDRSALPKDLRRPLPDTAGSTLDSLPAGSCRACSEPARLMERLVLGPHLHHRKCFACHRCGLALRRGLYTSVVARGCETFQCIRHEHQDLMDNLRKRDAEAPSGKEHGEEKPEESAAKAEADDSLSPFQEVEEEKEEAAEVSKQTAPAPQPNKETSFEAEDVQEPEKVGEEPEKTDTEALPPKETSFDAEEAPATVKEEEAPVPEADEQDSAPDVPPDSEPSEASADAALYPALPDLKIDEPSSPAASADPSPSLAASDTASPAPSTLEPDAPVAPPRRKRRSQAASPAPSPKPASDTPARPPKPPIAPKPKTAPPPVPPKPTLPAKDILDEYPDSKNPFGSEEEESDGEASTVGGGSGLGYDDSLNPFASDLEDDDAGSRQGDESVCSAGGGNPFGGDSDTDSGRVTSSPAASLDRVRLRGGRSPLRTPPKAAARMSLQPSSTPPTPAQRHSLIEAGFKPRRSAPPPPPAAKAKPPPRPATVPRKKRHAPPPPAPVKRDITTEELVSQEEVDAALEKLDSELASLESRGEVLETSLRELMASEEDWSSVEMSEWVCLLGRRAALLRREAELVLLWRGHYLDDFHADIEAQLRAVIEKPESAKDSADAQLEAHLLSLLLAVIERKNAIVEAQTAPAPLPDDDGTAQFGGTAQIGGTAQLEQKDKEEKKKRKLRLRLKKVKKELDGSKREKEERKKKEKEEKRERKAKDKDSKKADTLKA